MYNKMKIGYFADGVWGHNALKLLASDSDFDVRFIVPRFFSDDVIIKQLADDYSIDYLKCANINTKEFLRVISQYDCDILVSMSFDQIFKPIILSQYKVINCHAGKLPFYRGRNILNWVLINDEKEFGITVHYVDQGIDTGDIILQRTYPISDCDNYYTLLCKAHVECADVLYSALKKLKDGTATTIKQNTIHNVGMYCGKRQAGDEVINWDSTSRELFNFIRAICKPGPMALTFLNQKPLYINASQMIECSPIYVGIPGQILYKEGRNFIVKTKDSILKITAYNYEGNICVGDRLKNE